MDLNEIVIKGRVSAGLRCLIRSQTVMTIVRDHRIILHVGKFLELLNEHLLLNDYPLLS